MRVTSLGVVVGPRTARGSLALRVFHAFGRCFAVWPSGFPGATEVTCKIRHAVSQDDRLIELLDDRGWSALDLARAIGAHPRSVKRWLVHNPPPSEEHAIAIARILGVPAPDIWPDRWHRYETLASRVQQARLAQSLTVSDLASRSGVSAHRIREIERANHPPTRPKWSNALDRIGSVLGTDFQAIAPLPDDFYFS